MVDKELKEEELEKVSGGGYVPPLLCECGQSFDSIEELNKHKQSCSANILMCDTSTDALEKKVSDLN